MAFKYKNYSENGNVKTYRSDADAHQTYNESREVADLRNRLKTYESQKPANWNGGQYGQQVNDYMDRIANREKFSYNMNADALYQQYKDRYMRQGQMAMADTIGQAAALTGGYGNSYAETVGNQTYQSYLQNLNDVVPQLYQMAYDRYNQEGADMYNQLGMYRDAYNTEYGEYRDRVGDWQTEVGRLTDAYQNASQMDWSRFSADRDYYNNRYLSERDFDYGKYTGDRDFAKSNYEFAKNLALQQAQLNETIRHNMATEAASLARSGGSGGGGGRSSGGSSSGSTSGSTTTTTNKAKKNKSSSGIGSSTVPSASAGRFTVRGRYGGAF